MECPQLPKHRLACSRSRRLWPSAARVVLILGAMSLDSGFASAQNKACVLEPQQHDRSAKVLRCGSNVTIRSAAGTEYRIIKELTNEGAGAVRLDAGALLLKVEPRAAPRTFQILTPHAVAAVRGTTWAVEVSAVRTSTLVLSGAVRLTPRNSRRGRILRSGEGADLTSGEDSIIVKRWPAKRVEALVARFR
jgi:ferric-dicitrate binding protein FerR (iron transport regulator)